MLSFCHVLHLLISFGTVLSSNYIGGALSVSILLFYLIVFIIQLFDYIQKDKYKL